jgi:predicted TIM-barrel fold metal-dependent hydrolase
MPQVIDADTHVCESEAMWELMDKEMYPRRPVVISVPKDTWYNDRDAVWLIDGNIVPKPAGKASFFLITPSASTRESTRGDINIACREITDPKARLRDMDRLGVDVQVIYPTLFLIYLTDDVGLEIALCRAYNRWLADSCSKGGQRLRWIAILPLRSIEESLKEMKWAKDNGAVGLFFRGIEGDKTLDNPYLFPVYEAASKLNLPICIHTGSGAPSMMTIFNVQRNHTFAHNRILPMIAFRDLVSNGIPELFPTLRFGFIEASAGWVPFVLHTMRRLLRTRWKHGSGADVFREYRFYIACEADEDLPYLLQHIGEEHVIIGSDYGHNDPSEENQLVSTMRSRKDVPSQTVEKILCENPQRLYSF